MTFTKLSINILKGIWPLTWLDSFSKPLKPQSGLTKMQTITQICFAPTGKQKLMESLGYTS